MESIKNWLSGSRDFAVGKALYFQHGKSNALKDLFESMGDSSFTRGKLEKALTELAGQLKDVATSKPGTKKAVASLIPLSERPDAPDEVKALIEARKQLYGQAKAMHEKLYIMTVDHEERYNESERGIVATQLMRAWDDIELSWKRTLHFDREGKLPPAPLKVQIVFRPGDTLLRAITNKRSELSKTRKGIISKKTLEELEAELDELERMYEEESGDDTISE